MTRTTCIAIIALFISMLFQVLPVSGQDDQNTKQWTGRLSDEKILTKKELENILNDHKKWIETDRKERKRANLSKAILDGAYLSKAILSGADLSGAILSKAILDGADLSGADLHKAEMEEAFLGKAELGDATFEPNVLPDLAGIVMANNLSKMKYNLSPQALAKLREAFHNAGLRSKEREVSYAINRTLRLKLLENPNIFNKIQGAFYLVFFELTCAYGMSPGRLFLILIGFIIVFTIPYTVSISRNGKDGIWEVWISDRVRQDLGAKNPTRLTAAGLPALMKGFYFSIQSAFSIGWRDLNVGNWIARMQKYEYTLRATGWVRTVSGIQSLISVYLLALWVLSFFGRPFDNI